jgi:multisubunit Na+/H+ antiporter MnhF subunit
VQNTISNTSLIFTDGSAKGVAAAVIDGQTHIKQCPMMSTQQVELHVILLIFSLLTNQAFNLYTDSSYLYQVLHTIKTVLTSHTADEELFHLFLQLWGLIH